MPHVLTVSTSYERWGPGQPPSADGSSEGTGETTQAAAVGRPHLEIDDLRFVIYDCGKSVGSCGSPPLRRRLSESRIINHNS
jgi:hypothetical protein